MNQAKLLLIAAIAFVIALIDELTSKGSYDWMHPAKNMHWWGTTCVFILGGVFVAWFGLLLYSIFKKR